MSDDPIAEAAKVAAPVPQGATAGALLRKAREAQGLHIAALAAGLKVPQRKLEALERDAYDELPDAAFTRALAQAVCRTLKIDPAPVLALLPKPPASRLAEVATGLNMPFHDDSSGHAPLLQGLTGRPALWGVLVLMVAALALMFWPASDPVPAPDEVEIILPPQDLLPPPEAAASGPAEAAASAPEALPPAAPEPVEVAPAVAAPPKLELRTRAPSWVEVVDGEGKVQVSRTVPEGALLTLEGAGPWRLTIGNANQSELAFGGEPVDLVPHTRGNIARLVLP